MEVIFNWRTIVLQGCGGLCYLLLFTPLFLPSRLLQSARLAPCVIAQISLVTYFTHDSIYMSVLLSQFVPPSPSPTVFTSLENYFQLLPSLVFFHGAAPRTLLLKVLFRSAASASPGSV